EELLAGIRDCEHDILKSAAENFNLLFQEWDESVSASDKKAEVCLALAELSVLDTPLFRTALNDAARRLLPPYISSVAVTKAIGARDTGIAVNSVAARIKKLQKLKTNAYIYQPESSQSESKGWGRMVNLDKVMATIAVNAFNTNNKVSIPLATALTGCLFFEQHIEMTNLIAANSATLKNAAYCREILAKHSIGGISEEKMRSLLEKMFVPTVLSADGFEKWWTDAAPAHSSQKGRSFRDARSILELYTLLSASGEGDISVDDAAAAKLALLFSRIRPNMPPKDLATLAETIAMLSNAGNEEILKTMFSPLRGKVPFFPAAINGSVPLKNLEMWGRLAVKLLAGFIKSAGSLYTRYEMAKLFTLLPLRCMTSLMEFLTANDVMDAIYASDKVSGDVLLFIWKNKAKFGELKEYVNMANISRVLSEDGLPKEWAAAQRELKKLLFDKPDFQKLVIENAGDNVASLIYAVQKMRNMQMGECQSLLVKLSRNSDALKARLESGEGRKVLGSKEEEQADDSVLMTSLASYKRLANELEELVRVKIPENVKAIETARAFGDLSENAEYDAAKLQRSILRKRRSELENQLATVQPIDFAELKPTLEMVAIATQVTLKTADSKTLTYSFVGAFDGKPEANLIAYNTALGKALLGKKAGESLTLPEGGTAEVVKISALDSELVNSLAAEV
ncbi:MAG: GreA/GreB family elongation factor, partial [Lentisphaeria bacterium]|nr:GreA/GreB family elongation factor [Lentisphaeria bacterium]